MYHESIMNVSYDIRRLNKNVTFLRITLFVVLLIVFHFFSETPEFSSSVFFVLFVIVLKVTNWLSSSFPGDSMSWKSPDEADIVCSNIVPLNT